MHRSAKAKRIHGTGGLDKAMVFGMVERDGRVRAFHVDGRSKKELQEAIRDNIEAGSAIFTDELKSYDGLADDYEHAVVNHAIEYVNGNVHTNTIENFWIHGTGKIKIPTLTAQRCHDIWQVRRRRPCGSADTCNGELNDFDLRRRASSRRDQYRRIALSLYPQADITVTIPGRYLDRERKTGIRPLRSSITKLASSRFLPSRRHHWRAR